MFTADENGVFARVEASALRRTFACTVLFSLGALLVYAPLARPPALVWMIFMLGMGCLTLLLAEKLRRATQAALELTETDLRDSDGRILARMDEISAVERGVFAMKPSNGFTLILKSKKPRAWAPGLWWRIGRRIGVGGVTSAGQAKLMAEQIAFRIKDR